MKNSDMSFAKKIIACVVCLFIAGAVFADEGINAITGADVSASFLGNFFLNYDLAFDYQFEKDIAVGLGAKADWNVLQSGYEPHYVILPYIYSKFSHFTMNLGVSVDPTLLASEAPVLPYIGLGGIYLWNVGYGRLGLAFGTDLFFSLRDFTDENDTSAQQAAAAIFGSIFSVFNIPKVYVGIRYEIPIWNPKKSAADKADKLENQPSEEGTGSLNEI
ncbi:MAG: hypothetical protein K6G52_08365 [Treponemataceae bacterium]|nr:hypothetical protein [Treponemataceae bacterium]